MKKRYVLMLLGLMIFSIILSGCKAQDTNNNDFETRLKEKDEKINQLENRIKELEAKEDEPAIDRAENLLTRTVQVMDLLKNKDMEKLEDYIHPTKGVRFTPYPNVNIEEDQVFKADELAGALTSSQVYNWGNYDGSGEPIELSFIDYYDKFVYDEDFANPHIIGNNTIVGKGNIIDNVIEVYPNGRFIEFYFAGFKPEYEGMDWRSLKLVFEEQNGTWYLVGIIHGQWTI